LGAVNNFRKTPHRKKFPLESLTVCYEDYVKHLVVTVNFSKEMYAAEKYCSVLIFCQTVCQCGHFPASHKNLGKALEIPEVEHESGMQILIRTTDKEWPKVWRKFDFSAPLSALLISLSL
jgi:hypothetical protein